MIQEIFPHKLDNSFKPRDPKRGDRVLIYRDNSILISVDDDKNIRIPTFKQMMRFWPDIDEHATYLFSIDDEGFFMVDEKAADIRLPQGFRLENVLIFREYEPQYLAFAGITGHQLFKWYEETRYCGRCGSMMKNSTFERARVCPCCNYTIYPRLNPAVIVAVTDGKRLLMAQNRLSSYRPYGLIAGFVEFGESFEEAVRRELQEEVGIKVKNLRYYKSQPWAFSSSVMIGYFAELDGDDTLTVDNFELNDARWFSYDEIVEPNTNISIAQELIAIAKESIKLQDE